MRILVTGSSGHLGEALCRVLPDTVGIDILPSPYTTHVGSIADRDLVREAMRGVDAVLHTATLHKPHVGTHPRRAFVDTNVGGTLTLLEAAADAGVGRFVFTSTTSAFGRALTPGAGAPAAWITEDVVPRPRNVYGVTKTAAEDLCQLVVGPDVSAVDVQPLPYRCLHGSSPPRSKLRRCAARDETLRVTDRRRCRKPVGDGPLHGLRSPVCRCT